MPSCTSGALLRQLAIVKVGAHDAAPDSLVRTQEPGRRFDDHWQSAWRLARSGGFRAQIRKPAPHYRIADRGRRGLPVMVGKLGSRTGRHLRHSGRNCARHRPTRRSRAAGSRVCCRLGLPDRALPFIMRAAEIDPLAAIPPAMLGHLLVQLGETDRGLTQMRRARDLGPELPVTLAATTVVHDSSWVWTPGLMGARKLPSFAEYVVDMQMAAPFDRRRVQSLIVTRRPRRPRR